jgi:hypothetical protein
MRPRGINLAKSMPWQSSGDNAWGRLTWREMISRLILSFGREFHKKTWRHQSPQKTIGPFLQPATVELPTAFS